MTIGGEISARPLHFIWIADCSGSMNAEGRIQSLNTAIRETLPSMVEVANDNVQAKIFVRTIKFSSNVEWVNTQPIPIEDFSWTDLTAAGETDMGKALEMLAEQLKIPPMDERALPPVLVLVSDGQPTDDFNRGLAALNNVPWGKKAVRLAIAIGTSADISVLKKFIGNDEIEPLVATNPEKLTRYIKWASTEVLKADSSPASRTTSASESSSHVEIPEAPADDDIDAEDVW